MLAAADRVAERRGWDHEWGADARLLVLTHGISLALREREADAIDGDADESVKAAQAEARRRLMGLEGRYSTLRRRLFELRHNNRILRWRITALEVEAVGMRSRLDQFLVDRDRLEQAIAERIAAGAVPKPASTAASGAEPGASAGARTPRARLASGPPSRHARARRRGLQSRLGAYVRSGFSPLPPPRPRSPRSSVSMNSLKTPSFDSSITSAAGVRASCDGSSASPSLSKTIPA